MASFHVLHWIPDPKLHIFNGYNEVIETMIWGLRALGHEVSYGVNQLRADSVPIVFGAQLMDRPTLDSLPAGTILCNLEQLHGLRATGRALDDLGLAARRFTVWDYSTSNLAIWDELGAVGAVHVPVGFARFLSRITSAADQDIDVLLYGAPSVSRFTVLAELCARGFSAMFVCGLYGAARDALIARARTVLCLTSNAESGIFSIVRASYLLANRKAVIADLAEVERDIAEAVAFAPRDRVAALCEHVLRHPDERRRLEEAGYDAMSRRDIRAVLAPALDALPRRLAPC